MACDASSVRFTKATPSSRATCSAQSAKPSRVRRMRPFSQNFRGVSELMIGVAPRARVSRTNFRR